MRFKYYLSVNLSELVNYLESSEDLEFIQSTVHVLQVQVSDSEYLHFIFELIPSNDLQKYLTANEGKKILVFVNSKGFFKDLPFFLDKYNLDYIELACFEEFQGLLNAVLEEVKGGDDDDLLMMQKKEEVFKENEVWIKFLSCIPGVSTAKAEAICKEYPSFTHLLLGYNKLGEDSRPEMLKDIPTGSVSVGKAVSSKIYRYFNAEDPGEIL